jgi:nicotinamide N-methyltransferase
MGIYLAGVLSQPNEPLQLELVGHHSLWAHELWNAGIVMGQYFEEHPDLVCGKTTLELGAGAAVPSLIASLLGSAMVPQKSIRFLNQRL